MINRDRAWRRKKNRLNAKMTETKDWLLSQFQTPNAKKPIAEAKQHRHGALTRAQALRQQWSLNQEMADGL